MNATQSLQEQFEIMCGQLRVSNPQIAKMVCFIFQELRANKVAKDSTIAKNLMSLVANGSFAAIKIEAYELGFNG